MFTTKNMISNFFPVDLLYNGTRFSNAEQLYHYIRAKNAKDESLAFEIMLSTDPVGCKSLAKRIPQDQKKDLQVMKEVIDLKFSNDNFRHELEKTGTAKLIECNPHDRFWSAGCHIDDRDPANMKGVTTSGRFWNNKENVYFNKSVKTEMVKYLCNCEKFNGKT